MKPIVCPEGATCERAFPSTFLDMILAFLVKTFFAEFVKNSI